MVKWKALGVRIDINNHFLVNYIVASDR